MNRVKSVSFAAVDTADRSHHEAVLLVQRLFDVLEKFEYVLKYHLFLGFRVIRAIST